MENRRPITEDDVYLTELLLAKSYGSLKESVVKASSDALRSAGESVGGAVRRHPYATAGAAAGAGILLFLLFRLMGGGGSKGRRSHAVRDAVHHGIYRKSPGTDDRQGTGPGPGLGTGFSHSVSEIPGTFFLPPDIVSDKK